jgi:peptidoglycan L-alanyl-D-glutamate endopeptidase CwlK
MTFSQKSLARLSTCHDDLQLIMQEAIRLSNVDFGIMEGHRSIADQSKYFEKGLTKIDGINKKGKHNLTPSEAVDIYVYVKDKPELAYDSDHLSYVSGVIQTVAKILFEAGKIKHTIRWGGNWDGDGEILTDQSFDDRPHFELNIL